MGATDVTPSSRSGSTITAEIQGVIDACVKLTGMPDLTLSFMVSVSTGEQPPVAPSGQSEVGGEKISALVLAVRVRATGDGTCNTDVLVHVCSSQSGACIALRKSHMTYRGAVWPATELPDWVHKEMQSLPQRQKESLSLQAVIWSLKIEKRCPQHVTILI